MVAVYQAPLEDFISRRDALAKQLRAEKRRDDAALVKALRKPSRIAWALDGVVHEDQVSIEHLAVAIREAQSGADLRTGLEKVKEAVRSVAAAGARVAVRAGHPIEPNALLVRAKILRAKKNPAGAREQLVAMVRGGYDGFAVRMMLTGQQMWVKP